MKMWVVKHKEYSLNWWNLTFMESTDAEDSVLFYHVRLFPKRKWAKKYREVAGLDHMEIVAVEVTER